MQPACQNGASRRRCANIRIMSRSVAADRALGWNAGQSSKPSRFAINVKLAERHCILGDQHSQSRRLNLTAKVERVNLGSQGEHTFEDLAKIDAELLRLLHKRAELASGQRATADYVRRLAAGEELPAETLAVWLRHADSLCRQIRGVPEAACFLGPIYSYSYLAASNYFGAAANLVPVATIAAVFEEVERGHSRFGVVPIENNTDGRVVDTLGMFANSPAKICGEVLFPIHHCLAGRCRRDQITEIHSKPQALSQCRRWLAEHAPSARLVEVSSTASAAIAAANSNEIAAIASREAAIHNGLEIIDANIEDIQGNTTRFAVIGSEDVAPTGSDKTSLMFQLKHQPGALASAMRVFDSQGLNLTWIESFPLANCPNEYLFFVELDGHRQSQNVAKAIEELGKQTLRLNLLGSYAKGTL